MDDKKKQDQLERYRDYENMTDYPVINSLSAGYVDEVIIEPAHRLVSDAARRVRHVQIVLGDCDFIELTFKQETDMAHTIEPEALKRLADPFFEGGAETLYFAVVENRVYCGKVPANRVAGKPEHEQPANVMLTRDDSFVVLAEALNKLRT